MSETAEDAPSGSGAATFRVEGEWLTDFARALVAEGRWRQAARTLTDSLPGLTLDGAVAILRGDQKLLGVNTVELVAEDRPVAEEHRALVAWQYAGLWNRGSAGIWQPYAAVRSFCAADVPRWDPDSEMYGSMERWAKARVLYYADNPSDDEVTAGTPPGEERANVIWRRLHDVPIWLDGAYSDSDALAAFYAAGRRLEERKANPYREPLRRIAPDKSRSDEPHEFGRSDTLASLAGERFGTLGLEMVDAISGTQQNEDEAPEVDATFKHRGGYILPDGDFYGCGYMGHPALARRLFRHVLKVEVPPDAEKEADRRNWLRIQPSVTGGVNIMSPKGRPTKRQERTLADWCVAHGERYPESLEWS